MGTLEIDSRIFAQLQMLKCYGQKISDLIVARNANTFQVDIADYISRYSASSLSGSSAENVSYITATASTMNIVNIKGYDSAGNQIALTSYDSSTGMATFASSPAKVSYGYQTGYNNVVMDVTIGEEMQERHSTVTQGSSSGSGGCNNGIEIMNIVVLMSLFLRKKYHRRA